MTSTNLKSRQHRFLSKSPSIILAYISVYAVVTLVDFAKIYICFYFYHMIKYVLPTHVFFYITGQSATPYVYVHIQRNFYGCSSCRVLFLCFLCGTRKEVVWRCGASQNRDTTQVTRKIRDHWSGTRIKSVNTREWSKATVRFELSCTVTELSSIWTNG